MRSRPIPRWLADVVQALELDQQRLVTVADVLRVRPDLDRRVARTALVELSRRGWLHPVGVRGTYEFIPGAAAGPFPSGDPWLILRAALQRRPGAFHVGAHSAAWLLGYAERAPRPHIVVADTGIFIPRPLRAAYRVLTARPAPAHGEAAGLPVPTPPELFAEVAQLAPRLHLDAAAGWLRRLLRDVDPAEGAALLRKRTVTTRARAGYMAELCGAQEHANAIAPLVPARAGPFYTGPVGQGGAFSPRWRVYDSGHVAGATTATTATRHLRCQRNHCRRGRRRPMITLGYFRRHQQALGGAEDIVLLDVAQEYVLEQLRRQGLFDSTLVLKGGTALRKFVFGASGRFSVDLDRPGGTRLAQR